MIRIFPIIQISLEFVFDIIFDDNSSLLFLFWVNLILINSLLSKISSKEDITPSVTPDLPMFADTFNEWANRFSSLLWC